VREEDAAHLLDRFGMRLAGMVRAHHQLGIGVFDVGALAGDDAVVFRPRRRTERCG
jgi:hypothetical protein